MPTGLGGSSAGFGEDLKGAARLRLVAAIAEQGE
jgi:hypothetical protein